MRSQLSLESEGVRISLVLVQNTTITQCNNVIKDRLSEYILILIVVVYLYFY